VGRNFSPDFPSDSTHSVLVNEAFVRQARWKQAVGQQLTSHDNNKIYTGFFYSALSSPFLFRALDYLVYLFYLLKKE